MVRLGLRIVIVTLTAVLFLCCAAAQGGPCYVSEPDMGGGESCIFYGAGVTSEEDCQTFESELGRSRTSALLCDPWCCAVLLCTLLC